MLVSCDVLTCASVVDWVHFAGIHWVGIISHSFLALVNRRLIIMCDVNYSQKLCDNE